MGELIPAALASLGARFLDWRRSALEPRMMLLEVLRSADPVLVVGMVVVNVILGVLPVGFIVATSHLIGGVPGAVHEGTDSEAFRKLIGLFLVAASAFLMQQCLAPVQVALGERLKHGIDGRLRDEIMGIVTDCTNVAPLEEKETLNSLNEATRFFESGWNTPGMACSGLLALIARYSRLLGLLAIVALVASWWAALAVGVATMLLRYGQRGGLRKYSSVWREVSGLNRRSRYLRELAMGIDGAKEFRIFGLVDWLVARYVQSYWDVFAPVAARRRQVYLAPYFVYTPMVLIVGALVIATITRGGILGETSLLELALGLQATTSALVLGEFYPESDVQTQFGMQSMVALNEVRARLKRIADGRGLAALVPAGMPKRSLTFENVSFHYPNSKKMVMDGINLELRVGQCTALVGVNGVGKTTLVKLLTRLYEPTAGCIRADGMDIAELDPVAWRRQLSVVFQDFVRYELSAADNIALGAAHADRDDVAIAQAARRADILETLEKLERGLDTPLSRVYDGGVDLSGGQWQRIGIARALYALHAGARVLILDEPAAALDVRAETAFFDRFIELTRGATTLLISHRLSTVRRADRIVVIDGGRVVEQGCHTELIRAQGQYAQLFRLQAQRFAGEADVDDFGRSGGDRAFPGAPL